ncbi:hypothetical protein ACED30_13965 [Vibrio splendidus]|uniref:hypothetical protein n=1 Tax=Vibrio splendidus TaxID=29497 RepID=UPI00352D5E06
MSLLTETSIFPSLPDTEIYKSIILGVGHEHRSTGVVLYGISIYPLAILSGFDILSFMIFQQLFYFLGCYYICKAYITYLDFEKINYDYYLLIIIMVMFSFYPASIFYTSMALREWLMVFYVGVCSYGLTQWKYRRKLIYLLFGILGLVMIRPQLVVAVILTIGTMKIITKKKVVIALPFILLVAIEVFSTLIYPVDPVLLSKIRATWAENSGDQVYGTFIWNNWLDVIVDYPALFSQFLLSPLPLLHNRSIMSSLTGFVDLIFMLPVYFIFLWGLAKKGIKYYFSNPIFLLMIVIISSSALWEAYIGGAIRHRLVALVLLLPFVSHIIWFAIVSPSKNRN